MHIFSDKIINGRLKQHITDIGRYQLRYSGKRWVFVSDLYDEDETLPLIFLAYEHAVHSMKLLTNEWKAAGLVVPMIEIVGIDYGGNEHILKINYTT